MNKIAVALSGSGRTLDNLLKKAKMAWYFKYYSVKIVIASTDKCLGYEKAKQYGLKTYVASPDDVWQVCRDEGVSLLALAGYLKKLTVPEDFTNKAMNIHPSLLPAFGGKGMYGMNVHRAVVKAGVKVTGCTVHYVNNEYDAGPIILQYTCPVRENDTPESVAEKVFIQECWAYPDALRKHFGEKK